MNKIICEVCGTAYPDNAQQCPICGCAKPANPQMQSSMAAGEEAQAGYAYVKGGRFSKSNVRKRNNMAKAAAVYAEDDYEEDEVPKESNRGLTIAIIILLVAIIAVAAYIYIRFFSPSTAGKGKVETTPPAITTTVPDTTPAPTDPPETTVPSETTVPPETTPDLSCTAITVTDQNLSFDKLGSFWQLGATVEPANTPDQLTFTSSDPKVATVDATGKVVAVGDGSATITVSCGTMSTQCTVTVAVPKQDPNLKFNTYEPFSGSLSVNDVFYLKLRDADKNVMEVTNWTSGNTKVVTVNEEGRLKAVGEGTAIISCEYKGWVYECEIIVK